MNPGFEQAQQLANTWMEFFTRMATAGMAFRPEQPPTDAARSVRDATFTAMGQQADRYMRSPQFLEAMKESLDASIAFRKQLNELFTNAHHSVQGVARQDLDAVVQSVRHVETRVLDRIEALCEKLDEVSRRLDAIEQGNRNKDNNGHADRPLPARSLTSETE